MPPSALRLAVACALVVSGAQVLAAPAFALPDRIAYRCDVDICLVDPAAPASVTNLTDNGTASLDDAPAWSPDGVKLAFLSTFGSVTGRNVFVMEPDAPGQAVNLATQVTHFTNDGGYVTNPVWSPDGTRIAFERKPNLNGKVGIYVARSDGTTVTPVTITADGSHPTWSPDSTKIAFSTGEQVFVAPADGTGLPAPLASAAGHAPAWSPDGSRIALDVINPIEHDPFVDLRVVRTDGTGTPVTTPIVYTQWTFAAWSADGTRIAYRSTVGNDGHLRVVNADGTGDHPLAGRTYENDYAPTWSPDGSRVAFHGYRYDLLDPNAHTDEIYVASTTGGAGEPVALTTTDKNDAPAWRPDPAFRPVTPAGTPPTPAPGPTGGTGPAPARKPTVVWFTKRIPYTGGPIVRLGAVGCDAPVCNVGTKATTGATSGAAAAAARARPKPFVVGTGRTVVRQGQTRPLKLRLNRTGIRLLLKRRALAIHVTVTTTSPGRPKAAASHDFRIVVKPRKHR